MSGDAGRANGPDTRLSYTQNEGVAMAHGCVEGALVTEEPTAQPPAETALPEDEAVPGQEETPPQRSLWTLTSILLLAVVVLLAALLFRGCVAGSQGLGDTGGKSIVTIGDADAVPGVISIWIEEPATVEGVLKSSGVSASSIVDLGEGRYLIVVSEGVEDQTASRIAEHESVNDVGRVYEQDAER